LHESQNQLIDFEVMSFFQYIYLQGIACGISFYEKMTPVMQAIQVLDEQAMHNPEQHSWLVPQYYQHDTVPVAHHFFTT
jgi:hypothetical protein